ncbi:MAG TPA: hypothetical protein VLH12_08620 [Usitatibacter sp.]|nr:hypothetical protein [Usitatibacter sp.]
MATIKDLQQQITALRRQLKDGEPVTLQDIDSLLVLVSGGISTGAISTDGAGGPGPGDTGP